MFGHRPVLPRAVFRFTLTALFTTVITPYHPAVAYRDSRLIAAFRSACGHKQLATFLRFEIMKGETHRPIKRIHQRL
jgi:hypothetical protein